MSSVVAVKTQIVFLQMSIFMVMASLAGKPFHQKPPPVDSLFVKHSFYGQASYYADKFNGRKTASGEVFSQKKFTAACNILPLGTKIKVTNLSNGKSVILTTNDRLHPGMRRVADLSKAAANQLGYIRAGLTRVRIDVMPK